jgi:putative zinc finger/helix-turn-helix YgiT family protein
MTHEQTVDGPGKRGDRPFPWLCPNCLQEEVHPEVMPYSTDVMHDGRRYHLEIPQISIPKCRACGKVFISNRVDEEILRALRAQARLLMPEQIKGAREELRLKSKDLAERLGVAAETISRWERGGLIQSRAMDNLLRLYFVCPTVRAVLRGAEQDPDLGTTVIPDGSAPPGAGPPEPPPNRLKPRFQTNVEPHRKRAELFDLAFEKN